MRIYIELYPPFKVDTEQDSNFEGIFCKITYREMHIKKHIIYDMLRRT